MFELLVRKIIKGEQAEGKIDVSLVNDREIHQLNKRWRKKDKPTDVLAFTYGSSGLLGDVIISTETTKKNAERYGVTYRSELKRLVVHGVLHVLSYDHGRRMSSAEKIYQKF